MSRILIAALALGVAVLAAQVAWLRRAMRIRDVIGSA